MFLAAGLALVTATVLLPAWRDLEDLRWRRDAALASEGVQRERVFRHERYALALQGHDPQVVRAMAAAQLNRAPAEREPLRLIAVSSEGVGEPASLEPPPAHLRARHEAASRLERWATDRHGRLWLIAGGMMCVLLGVLPRASDARA